MLQQASLKPISRSFDPHQAGTYLKPRKRSNQHGVSRRNSRYRCIQAGDDLIDHFRETRSINPPKRNNRPFDAIYSPSQNHTELMLENPTLVLEIIEVAIYHVKLFVLAVTSSKRQAGVNFWEDGALIIFGLMPLWSARVGGFER